VLCELRRTYAALRHEFEDISQMVHTKLVANLRSDRFEGRSSLWGYVSAIVHHTAIDRLRALYRDRALAESASDRPESAADNPYRTVAARDERNELSQILLTLPRSCRKLWQMVFVENLPYDEIASRLSIPAGTVKSRMWHCRRKAMIALDRFRRLARGGRSLRLSRLDLP
jgi:RNA polymerase sigma factor (sigma-70 family)